MADNTLVNTGTGDDMRTVDRLTAGVKTQVVQLDVGGAHTNAESLVSSSNPLPVSDSTAETALGTLHTDLAELAVINTSIGTLNTDLNTLHTDIATTTHGDLTTLNTSVGATNTALATLNTDLVGIHTDVGTTLHADITTTNTKLNGGLPAALQANGGLKIEGVAGGVPIPVSTSPATTGGLSVSRSLNLLHTGMVAKASAGQLFGWYIYNGATTARFLKIYDKATAGIPGTDVPILTIPLPAGPSAANLLSGNGIQFSNGISAIATTLIADTDTTDPSTNDVVVNLFYK